jgi:uncharacterized protein YciI
MRLFYTISLTAFMITLFFSCQDAKPPEVENSAESSVTEKTEYDSVRAKSYGADPMGMKKYVFAFLKRGPNQEADSAEAANLQRAHLQNIISMAEAGKLVLAGPFMDDGDLRGIYVFNVQSIPEAEALTNTDPAIQAGVLEMELKEWYGSAALMAVNEIHETLSQQSVVDQ